MSASEQETTAGDPAPDVSAAERSARGELGDYHERFVPELHREMLLGSEHFARYAWASALAPGRRTLDAGCGAGYGVELMLAAGAEAASGIDVDPGAVTATRNRLEDRAEVKEGDLMSIPFADASFGLVTCFEVIEHVVDQPRALDELRRVLEPGGALAISSPQRGAFPEGNPWHLHEFTEEELAAALGERFEHVQMFGQQPHYGSLIAPAAVHDADEGEEIEVAATRKLAGTAPGAFTYTLALASDEPLPDPGSLTVLGGGVDVKAMVDAYSYWERRARRAEAERDLEAMDHYRTDLYREIAMERLDEALRGDSDPSAPRRPSSARRAYWRLRSRAAAALNRVRR